MVTHSPVELVLPIRLRVLHPLLAYAELTMVAFVLLILIRIFRNRTQSEQGLEILQLLVFYMKLKWCRLLLRAHWHRSEKLSWRHSWYV